MFASNIGFDKSYYGKNRDNFDSVLILGGNEDRILHGAYLSKLNPDAKIIFLGGSNLILESKEQSFKDENEIFLFFQKN